MRVMRFVSIIIFTLVVAACGGSDGGSEPMPTVDGSWQGSWGAGGTITLALTQNAQAVSGNGSMSGPGGAAALTASGTFNNPSFSLTLTSPGFSPINYAGTMQGNTMQGLMNGSGFNNASVTLTKQ